MLRELSNEQRELLVRIGGFAIDEGCPELSFSGRLARENGWTCEYADRVVVEYLRFVGLAMVSGHVVTPSEQVDQAWHLHLTYTRSYWLRLCAEVLGCPLHHGPTRGGMAESRKYVEQYEKTLRSYQEIFGVSPPVDIWPKAEIRFGRDLLAVRLNPSDYWMIPRIRLRLTGWRLGSWLLTLFSLSVLIDPEVSGAVESRSSVFGTQAFGLLQQLKEAWSSDSETKFDAILLSAVLIAAWPAEFLVRRVLEAMDNRQGNGMPGFDLEAEVSGISRAEVAMLRKRAPRLIKAALGDLVASRRCRIVEETGTIELMTESGEVPEMDGQTDEDEDVDEGVIDPAADATWNSITAAVLNCLPLEKKGGLQRVQLSPEFAVLAREVQVNLERRRLMTADPYRWGQILGLGTDRVLLLAGAVCCAALAAILTGLGLTGIWLLRTILAALIMLVIWPAIRLGLQKLYHPVTARGIAVIERLLEMLGGKAERPLIRRDPALAIAIHGSKSLQKSKDPELRRLHRWLTPAPFAAGGCGGCGSNFTSSGDGGGCGGAGGCGGCGGGGCGGCGGCGG